MILYLHGFTSGPQSHKAQALEIIKAELGSEIAAAANRLARRRAKAAAKASGK